MDSLFENQDIKLPSERKFGILFVSVFALAGGYSLYKIQSLSWALFWFALAVTLLGVTLICPGRLSRLNRIWFEFGLLLGKVVSPVVLGAIFYLLLFPIGLIMRLAGRDALRLRKRNLTSYWLDRKQDRPFASSFKDQF
jgi:hypothetical protein